MTLWKDDRGWRYSFKFQRQKFSSKRFKTKKAADTALGEHRKKVKDLFGRQLKREKIGIIFSHLAEEYLDWSKKRHALKTYQYKAMVCREFIRHSGDIPLNPLQMVPKTIESYLNTRPSNHNFNTHRKELRAVFNFGIYKGLIPGPNPVNCVDKLPEDQTVHHIPSQEEMVKVLLAAGDDRPLLLVLLHTLARISEILGLRWHDVNFSQSSIRLWTRKRKGGGLEYDDLPMGEELKEVLRALWENRTQEEWVFLNEHTGQRYIRRPKLMAGICKRAGVKPFGFHAIRHFAASFIADQDKVSIKAISGLLRHKSLRTTEQYLHHVSESQRMAIETLSELKVLPTGTPKMKQGAMDIP